MKRDDLSRSEIIKIIAHNAKMTKEENSQYVLNGKHCKCCGGETTSAFPHKIFCVRCNITLPEWMVVA